MLQNFTYGSKNQQHFSTNISANRQARSASCFGVTSLSSKHQAVTTPVSPLAKKSASRSVSFILPSASCSQDTCGNGVEVFGKAVLCFAVKQLAEKLPLSVDVGKQLGKCVRYVAVVQAVGKRYKQFAEKNVVD